MSTNENKNQPNVKDTPKDEKKPANSNSAKKTETKANQSGGAAWKNKNKKS